MYPTVFIAILAKNKQYVLPLFLSRLLDLDYPKASICLYMRSNNNTDNTVGILEDFVLKNRSKYREVITDFSNVPEKVEAYGEHEWNSVRFGVLARIRQKSMDLSYSKGYSYYFVIDCDNFITPQTLKYLINANVDVVGPLLHNLDERGNMYSNYHHCADVNGYFRHCEHYNGVYHRAPEYTGIIPVDVIHCTYLIKHDVIPMLSYSDGSPDYEYVIFSRSCRSNNIQQYIDNRYNYGILTFQGEKFVSHELTFTSRLSQLTSEIPHISLDLVESTSSHSSDISDISDISSYDYRNNWTHWIILGTILILLILMILWFIIRSFCLKR